MESLNDLYRRLLQVGMIVLREAIRSDQQDWAEAEIEFLHNAPSLIDEPNANRHHYFWFTERPAYLEWVSASGCRKAESRMRTYYKPILSEMEPVMMEFVRSADSSNHAQVTP